MAKSLFEQNGGTYRIVGDYNIPNLTLPPEDANIRLGKWGMLHKDYLHNHKKVLFTTLLTQGKLYQHCAEIENQANAMFDTIFHFFKFHIYAKSMVVRRIISTLFPIKRGVGLKPTPGKTVI